MDIQANPVNSKGEEVTPVVWESNCLEEVCGACTMLINGKVHQSCSALVDQLKKPILSVRISRKRSGGFEIEFCDMNTFCCFLQNYRLCPKNIAP